MRATDERVDPEPNCYQSCQCQDDQQGAEFVAGQVHKLGSQ